MMYLTEIEQAVMKFIWKNKKARIAKAILSRMSKAGGIAIPDLQLYYKAIITNYQLCEERAYRVGESLCQSYFI